MRMGGYLLSLLTVCMLISVAAEATVGKKADWERPRVALIVGVGAYQHLEPLANPPRDAELIATTAKAQGFVVSLIIDPTHKDLIKAMLELRSAVVSTKAVAMVYFSGHAVQVSGRNLMLPVEAKASSDGIDIDEVYAALQSRGPDDINIVILDACRDDPFGHGAGGLAKPLATASGLYIAYAAAPGQVAFDGAGKHSPFATALANAMQMPGFTIEEALKEVRAEVGLATRGEQSPWDSSSLRTRFHFVPRRTIFPDSSQRRLADEDLAPLDCPSLWIARNEIFKRHGYCFATPRGQDYFDNTGCTTPDQDVVKRQATGTPLDNIERIIQEESRRSCRGGKPPLTASPSPASTPPSPSSPLPGR